MKLTRNTTPDGRGKYALVRLDKIRDLPHGSEIEERAAKALDELAAFGLLEYGEKGSEEEFFAIKLKDEHAQAALTCYLDSIMNQDVVDQEFACDLFDLAIRARNHPSRKSPRLKGHNAKI